MTLIILLSIVLSLITIHFVSADTFTFSRHPPRKTCLKPLQKVVCQPEGCASKYLQGLAHVLKSDRKGLFASTASRDLILFSLAQQYQITIQIVNAFGKVIQYLPNGSKTPGLPVQYSNTARNYLNQAGFVREVKLGNFYYSFALFDKEVDYLAINLVLPLDRDPIAC